MSLASGCGTLYKLTANGTNYTKTIVTYFGGPHQVLAPSSTLRVVGGTLYGAASSTAGAIAGIVFSIAPPGTQLKIAATLRANTNLGSGPNGLVASKQGVLYTTTIGGALDNPYACTNGCGAVVGFMPSGTTYRPGVLYDFTGGTDGGHPVGTLVTDAAGALYGVTSAGGNAAYQCGNGTCGTVFKVVPSGKRSVETVLFNFNGITGGLPGAGLIADAAGNFYGTASIGGQSTCECGVVYKLARSGSGYTQSVLHAFNGGRDGYAPRAALVLGARGVLYGTTSAGGGGVCAGHGCGTVFALTPAANGYTETILHRFSGARDGNTPVSSLTLVNGKLFGTTSQGGSAAGAGTVFEVTP
jgi:uncharacterized repeat protein (TIGR03803 family)